MSDTKLIPTLKWAQDKDNLYCTINVSDLDTAHMTIEEKSIQFWGSKLERSGDVVKYELGFELSSDVVPEGSSWAKRDRNVALLLAKKESGVFWNALPEESKKWKQHVQIDWDRWVDEDEDDETSDPSKGFGDMAGGMPGMGGPGGMDMQALMEQMNDKVSNDSDDESDNDVKNMPELEGAAMAPETPAQ